VAVFAKPLHASAVLLVQGGIAYMTCFFILCVGYTAEVRAIVPEHCFKKQNYSL